MNKNLLFKVFLLVVFSGCRGGGDGTVNQPTLLTVTQIVDGNTVRSEATEIDILGVKDTPEAQRFLEENLLHREISVVRDAGRKTVDNGIPLYVNTADGTAINGLMLRAGVAQLNKKGVTDSLSAFREYVSGSSPSAIVSSNRTPAKITEPNAPVADKKRSFKAVVKEREKGVFLVVNLNGYNQQQGIGTGFFITDGGIAVSNYHVFEGGENWLIKTAKGEVRRVTEVYYADDKNDFVIFQVDLEGLAVVPVPLFEGKVEKGEEIFVLGNPNGLESSLTRGVVSAIRVGHFDMENLIQIDAAISPGSSGSPVMTMEGTAIGIATLKQRDCENCNFAVNIKTVWNALRTDND